MAKSWSTLFNRSQKLSPLSVFAAAFSIYLTLSTVTVSSAQAVDFSIIGAASSSSYNISPSPDVLAGGTGFGLGLRLAFELFPFVSIEFGPHYISHSFTTSVGSSSATIYYNYIQIPVLLQLNPVPFISMEAGGYYGIPTSTSTNGTVPSVLTSTSSSTFSTSNDIGLLAGAGLRIPLLPLMSFRVDVLYEYGLSNLSTGTYTQNSRNLDVWAGIMITLL